MNKSCKIFRTIGFMSGTSLDGIDLAYLKTDGEKSIEVLGHFFMPYPDHLKQKIKKILGQVDVTDQIKKIAEEITDLHIKCLNVFLQKEGLSKNEIDLIGFHGQTIYHNPAERQTIQIGNPGKISTYFHCPVIANLRLNDVHHGGQGAPLVPIYHLALAQKLKFEWPVCFVNIGGIANLTYIPSDDPYEMIAFDTGPGNCLLDEWCERHFKVAYDQDGQFSAKGKADEDFVLKALKHPYFSLAFPKSLDRLDFYPLLNEIERLSAEDGAASLTEITVQSILYGIKSLPAMPRSLIILGGGRKNKTMMKSLSKAFNIINCDNIGLIGDGIEAEAFAYLAARSYHYKEITFPKTTGVQIPLPGGKIYHYMD